MANLLTKTQRALVLACMMAFCLALCACGNSAASSSSASESSAASSSTAASSSSSDSGSEASSSATEGESTTASTEASSSSADAADASSSSTAESSSSATESSSASANFSDPAYVDFVGTWKLAGMSNGTDVFMVKDADQAVQDQVATSLVLNEDGSASIIQVDSEIKGTWTTTSNITIAIAFDFAEEFPDAEPYTGTLENGTLALQEGDLVMLLEKE